jgi:hypothetical protein
MRGQELRKLTIIDGQQSKTSSAERKKDYSTIFSRLSRQERTLFLCIAPSIPKASLKLLRVPRTLTKANSIMVTLTSQMRSQAAEAKDQAQLIDLRITVL